MLNITIPVSVHSVPKNYSEVKSLTANFIKNPAYKNINNSQLIISKTIELKK